LGHPVESEHAVQCHGHYHAAAWDYISHSDYRGERRGINPLEYAPCLQ